MIKPFDSYEECIDNIKYIDNRCKCNCRSTVFLEKTSLGFPVLRFRRALELDWMYQGFSTRLGGTSSEHLSYMNLSYNTGDDPDKVLNNFRLMSEVTGIECERMIYSKQTHTTNVIVVDEALAGSGVVKPTAFEDIDGLVTDRSRLCLVTSYADCIPVTIIDPVHKAIACVHSGWRGTVGNISANAVKLMMEHFHSEPDKLIALVGPGICENCYEVSRDVVDKFTAKYSADECLDIIKEGKAPDKYQLNLLNANAINLINLGLHPQNIEIGDICTCCNPRLLFSHRASDGKRGLMCNFVYII